MDEKLKHKVVSLVVAIFGVIGFGSVVTAGLSGFGTPLTLAGIEIDSAEYGGVDYPNWTHGSLCMGVTYDLGLEVYANEDVSDFYMVVQFEKTGILPGDVAVHCWNGTAWGGCCFDTTEMTLTYHFPETHFSLAKGDTMVIPILVVFQATGNYTSSIWAEGFR
jgi:hypothetical protein